MQIKHLARTALCIALVAAFSACGKRQEAAPEAAPAAAVAPAPAAPGALAKTDSLAKPQLMAEARNAAADAAPADMTTQLTSSAAAPSLNDGERKFIRTAHVHFRVKDVYQSALTIEDAVAGQGGFVVRNEIGSSILRAQRRPIGEGKVMELAEYAVNGELVVRVPSDKTQELLRSIANQIAFLDQRSFEAREAQFDLLRQRLEYQRNQEAQQELGELNKENGKLHHKADVINSRNEAKAARDNARVAQKQFEDQIAFSTIRLSLYQLPKVRETEMNDIDEVFRQSRPSLGSRLVLALSNGWNSALDFVVALAGAWPLWLMIAVIAAGLLRFKRYRQQRSNMRGEQTAD